MPWDHLLTTSRILRNTWSVNLSSEYFTNGYVTTFIALLNVCKIWLNKYINWKKNVVFVFIIIFRIYSTSVLNTMKHMHRENIQHLHLRNKFCVFFFHCDIIYIWQCTVTWHSLFIGDWKVICIIGFIEEPEITV